MSPTFTPLTGEAALAHAALVANPAFQTGVLGVLLVFSAVALAGHAFVRRAPLSALGAAVAGIASWLVLA